MALCTPIAPVATHTRRRIKIEGLLSANVMVAIVYIVLVVFLAVASRMFLVGAKVLGLCSGKPRRRSTSLLPADDPRSPLLPHHLHHTHLNIHHPPTYQRRPPLLAPAVSMPTRELIHLSFGSLPAHFSTHHFNAQTGYFDYSPQAPQPLVDHDVSWHEGIDGRGSQRYTPRWLVFDVRSGFEGLRRQEASKAQAEGQGGQDDDDDDDDYQGNLVAEASASWLSAPQIVRTQHRVARTPFRRIAQRERRGEDLDWDQEMEVIMASDEEDTEEDQDDNNEGFVLNPTSEAAEMTSQATSSSRRYAQRRVKPWSSRLVFESHPRSLVPVTAAGGLPLEDMATDSESASHEGIEVFESFEQGWARAKAWDRVSR